MEQDNFNQEEFAVEQRSSIHRVTPLSKYLALTLFIILPFIGGYIGYTFAPEKVIEVEKFIAQDESSPENLIENPDEQSQLLNEITPSDGYEASNLKLSLDERFVLYREGKVLGSDDPGHYMVLDRQSGVTNKVVFEEDAELYKKYLDPNNETDFNLRYINVLSMEWSGSISVDGVKGTFLTAIVGSVDQFSEPAFYSVQYKSASSETPWILVPFGAYMEHN